MAAKDRLTVEYSPGTGTLTELPRRRTKRSVASPATKQRGRPTPKPESASTEALEAVGVIDLLIAGGSGVVTTMEALKQLQDALGVAARLRAISQRIGTGIDETLLALSTLASQTPTESSDPVSSLSEAEEGLLREAGSLNAPMPALGKRPSARTTVAAVQLLEGALTVQEAAARLNVSAGRVRQRLTERTVLGVESAGVWKLPKFQFDASGHVRGLDQVLPALPEDVHPLVVFRFLTQPSTELLIGDEPVSPIDWLTTGGHTGRVVALAEELHALP